MSLFQVDAFASLLSSDRPAVLWLLDEWRISRDSGQHEFVLPLRYAGLQPRGQRLIICPFSGTGRAVIFRC